MAAVSRLNYMYRTFDVLFMDPVKISTDTELPS